MQIETLFTIDPYLGTDQMINPALVVAGIRDTLPARVGAMSPAKARLGEYGRKMLASRYLQRVTNVTPGTVSTAGNPHVGNELFGLLDGEWPNPRCNVLALPDLEQSRAAVLNSLYIKKRPTNDSELTRALRAGGE